MPNRRAPRRRPTSRPHSRPWPRPLSTTSMHSVLNFARAFVLRLTGRLLYVWLCTWLQAGDRRRRQLGRAVLVHRQGKVHLQGPGCSRVVRCAPCDASSRFCAHHRTSASSAKSRATGTAKATTNSSSVSRESFGSRPALNAFLLAPLCSRQVLLLSRVPHTAD